MCGDVVCGLRYAGLTGGDKIEISVPENLRGPLRGPSREIANMLSLLIAWLSTDPAVGSARIEWNAEESAAATPELSARVQVLAGGSPLHGIDVCGFADLPSVSELLLSIGGNLDFPAPDRMTLTIPLAGAVPLKGHPIEIADAIEDIGDAELCLGLIEEFLHRTRALFDDLAACLSAGDAAAVHRIAHTIKGGASNIRAPRLRETAAELERDAKGGRLHNGDRYLARIREELDTAAEYFIIFKQENKDGSEKSPLR